MKKTKIFKIKASVNDHYKGTVKNDVYIDAEAKKDITRDMVIEKFFNSFRPALLISNATNFRILSFEDVSEYNETILSSLNL